MHSVHSAATRIRGYCGEQGRVRNPKTGLFAFHVPARLQLSRVLISSRQKRISFCFRPIDCRHTREKQKSHCCPHSPSVALRASHAAERVGQPGWNGEYQQHLEKIREWCRIFERMRAIDAEKSAAIRAEFLDHFL